VPTVAVGAVIMVLFFGSWYAQSRMDELRCGSIDPGEAANYSDVLILNDLEQSVVVGDCRGTYCRADQGQTTLAPGARMSTHAACNADGSAMTSWKVTRTDGTIMGFIAVHTIAKTDGLIVPVSGAGSGRLTVTPPLVR
jgi:hypothetical protein